MNIRAAIIVFVCFLPAFYAPAQESLEELISAAKAQNLDAERLERLAREGEAKKQSEERIREALKRDLEHQAAARLMLGEGERENLGAAADALRAGFAETELKGLIGSHREKGGEASNLRYALMQTASLKLRGVSEEKIRILISIMAEKRATKEEYIRITDAISQIERAGGRSADDSVGIFYEYIDKQGGFEGALRAISRDFPKGKSFLPVKIEKITTQQGAKEHPKGAPPGRGPPKKQKEAAEKGKSSEKAAPKEKGPPITPPGLKDKDVTPPGKGL